jgi:AcrR family transcriptional regulator
MVSSTLQRTTARSGTRESLLNAASRKLARLPWSAVRMVDVAAMAGVSRQTLYNEFGSKEGLAHALVRREADAYLTSVDRALATHSDASERLAATAEWTTSSPRDNALVHALLTGCWSEQLPSPTMSGAPSPCPWAGPRRTGGPLPSPTDFVALVRDRAVDVLSSPGTPKADMVDLARSCELVVRLALSCVTAPPGGGGVTDLVRDALHRLQPSDQHGSLLSADAARVRTLAGEQ